MIVTLPRKTIDHFTLYAEGCLIKKFFIKHETQHSFIFDDNYVLFLFYTYPHHRRAYVVTVDKIGLLPKTRLGKIRRFMLKDLLEDKVEAPEKKVEKKVEFGLKYSAIYRIWQKEKTL